MPIQFTCPHCGLRTDVSDEFAGQSGPCAGCGQTVTVPPLSEGLTYAPPSKRSAAPIVLILILALVVLTVVACGGFLFLGVSRAIPAAGQAATRAQCSNNLRQIGIAMLNYHDTYGSYPPAYIPDEKGQPKHSWRVLLLPYLEEKALYDQYDFDEPWDSPGNAALGNLMPEVYRCPSDTLSAFSETSYAMIVGPGTISDGAGASKIAEITDGTAVTILVVEAAGSGIHWLDPRDLEADQISYLVNDPVDASIVGDHADGANVLFSDGSVMFVPGSADPEDVKAMCTVSGSETVDRYKVEFGGRAGR